jgi:twitching motility protein PilT
MASPANAPLPLTLDLSSGSGGMATHALLTALLRSCDQISDLIFSPGRPPQVEVHGQLLTVQGKDLQPLTADDTRRIASDLLGGNKQAVNLLREQGYCDVSFGLPGVARFRSNVFIQRGSCAIVMRVIPSEIPTFQNLGLPLKLQQVASLRDGIVLVTGPRGSGKSSTLAALLDRINQQQVCHIITIEDPIEFLHNHKKATVHQRELHSDTPSFALALRAAMRQAPKVLLVSEMRDRETMEVVLEAAETGHLVLSSLNTINATQSVERIVSSFPASEHVSVRGRLARSLRWVVSQRLLPRRDGVGRVPAFEILEMGPVIQDAIQRNISLGESLQDLVESGSCTGLQRFDKEIARLVQNGVVDFETAMVHANDPLELRNILQ